MDHQIILNKVVQSGLVPLFTHHDLELAKSVLDAAYDSGVRVFEYTNRHSNAFEVFKSLKIYADKYPDLMLGIGTIFEVSDAQRFHNAGADFIISPAMIGEVAEFCQSRGIFYVPGCATVTEVYQGKKMGSSLIKIFPGNVLGPAFVKAVLSVIPDIKLMATGGVEPNEDNLRTWFNAGIHCVGMGSQLFDLKSLERGDFSGLKSHIEKSLTIIQNLKK
ncbi:bifunctional 4-hydroxy-2-oxoglutarate aldolase/2-dehydro-3-deoxy-phosphogluconate aldolase [Cecembia calidifontis]|jgi:2-dehydro-3-deoxyphosphogluconate aldolase/(4S)-4-hydroxy-2-oxoglutarate aldolase|uniref:2-dehydro-3-deoxyphosphogluconate aldolase/(4S)-4-hydroxy-2-oxoglutarate aldolase n=1 Tax=Cecembia calidifontis TaxID=1187080 RepID=A0A4Q7PFM6_9BACT|nr:bifunctional 4-hydroxy-2-oxoglutarate aldolase/2-dehydro-3-deoxy-phosphogluconate aldolase [Cecembia calidifontis]RZS97662.1 2-dehydro-3-deoxyphosphogluconate aldolase/(4S)-4-hydroxy-2-oxoglutarate aldolase [Cecembia calidifontis]